MTTRSGTETRQRTSILPVRLSPAEREALEALVRKTGCSRAALIRHGIFGVPPPRAIPRSGADHEAIARLLAELGKIGSNVNQLARHANAGRFQSNSIELAMRDLLILRRACLKALGEKE